MSSFYVTNVLDHAVDETSLDIPLDTLYSGVILMDIQFNVGNSGKKKKPVNSKSMFTLD